MASRGSQLVAISSAIVDVSAYCEELVAVGFSLSCDDGLRQ